MILTTNKFSLFPARGSSKMKEAMDGRKGLIGEISLLRFRDISPFIASVWFRGSKEKNAIKLLEKAIRKEDSHFDFEKDFLIIIKPKKT